MLKWILFDLNSFFASCEQQENPKLRGKPIAVVPSLNDTTSVIAASYEAKAKGIKTGTLVRDARRMCPGIHFIAGNHRLYTDYHHKIVAAVEEVLPIKKILSIDEVACELIGRERERENALKIAQQMKQHVLNTVGCEIKSSVGIGPNILLAKIASDLQKPDGLVVIDTHEVREKIGSKPVEIIPGVGAQTKIKLNRLGISCVQDILDISPQEARKRWGSIWGLRVAEELRGHDLTLQRSENSKSMSHEHVLPPKFRTSEGAYQVVLKLLSKGAARLRQEGAKAQRFGIRVRFRDGSVFEKSIRIADADDVFFFIRQAGVLWQDFPAKQVPFKVAVVFSDLLHSAGQLSFFDDQKRSNINAALDSINRKFGSNTLYLAGFQQALTTAKTRISFNHVPEPDDEFDEGV